jgi:hypothetical protein
LPPKSGKKGAVYLPPRPPGQKSNRKELKIMYYTIEIMHFDDHVFTSDFIESKSELLDILDVLLKPSMFGSDDFEIKIIQVPKKHD